MFDSVFGRSFNSAKCKTLLRLAISRIKLLRNKRDIQLKQMKRELAQLLQTNQEPSAWIRVEHIYREQNVMAAYEIIELFCELIVVRLPIIDSQRQCPIDLREAIASLIFAAPRCSDVPELLQVRNLLSAKYGKEFVFAAAELRPDCGVNRLVIEKLSVRAPAGDVKVKLMKDIAVEQNVDWDPTDVESQFLRAPEDLLEGPTHFLGASQMSLETPCEESSSTTEPVVQQNQKSESQDSMGTAFQSFEDPSDEKQFIPFVLPVVGDQIPISRKQSTAQRVNSQVLRDTQTKSSHNSQPTSLHRRKSLGSDCGEDAAQAVNSREESYKDIVSAARAAAESAERAAAAARAAALLASKTLDRTAGEASSDSDDDDNGNITSQMETGSPDRHYKSQFDSFNDHSASEKPLFDEPEEEEGSQSSSRFSTRRTTWKEHSDGDTSMAGKSIWPTSTTIIGNYDDDHARNTGASFTNSWHFNNNEAFTSTNSGSAGAVPHFDTDQTDIGDTEAEDVAQNFAGAEQPMIVKTASKNPHVHPKLPDYDELTARFEALRSKQ